MSTALWFVLVIGVAQSLHSQPHVHHAHHAGLAHAHKLHDTNSSRLIHHGSHTHTLAETQRDSGYIFMVLLITVMVTQVTLISWKKYHARSFQLVSLLLLWLIPCIWSFYQVFVRLLVLWSAFSMITGRIMWRASQRKIDKTTPRAVYQWFYVAYQGCYVLSAFGNLCIMCDILGISQLFPAVLYPASKYGVIFLFYGLYFGVLGRDSAILCADQMAATMGYFSKSGLPSKDLPRNICAICDDVLFKNLRLDQDDSVNETIFTLGCGHQFHESCIRGWTIIGKRDTCAYCSEKVNLREMFSNPWETQNIAWGVILDFIRYLIVYNPMICIIMQVVLQIVY